MTVLFLILPLVRNSVHPPATQPRPGAHQRLLSCLDALGRYREDAVSNSKATRLTDKYPNAYSDFLWFQYHLRLQVWPVRMGPLAQRIVREPRPVHGHAIQPMWVSISTRICDELESVGIMWTSINPLAYANAGEPKPFCPLIVCVGMNPGSLFHGAAVAAAAVVKNILTDAGFPDIEVAYVESVVACFTGPKLLSFNPSVDKVPDLRKSFTPVLDLSIAPRMYPYYEGTAALYFRLSKRQQLEPSRSPNLRSRSLVLLLSTPTQA